MSTQTHSGSDPSHRRDAAPLFVDNDVDAARGERITAAMRRQGITYNCQLCYDIGVSESTLSRWRSGRPISLSHAVALSYALGIDLDYLLIGPSAGEHDNSFNTQLSTLSQTCRSLNAKNKALLLKLLRSLVSRQL